MQIQRFPAADWFGGAETQRRELGDDRQNDQRENGLGADAPHLYSAASAPPREISSSTLRGDGVTALHRVGAPKDRRLESEPPHESAASPLGPRRDARGLSAGRRCGSYRSKATCR